MAEKILTCTKCGKSYRVASFDEERRYRCRSCSETLQTASLVAAGAGAGLEEALPEEVHQAQKDPARRVGKFVLVSEPVDAGPGRRREDGDGLHQARNVHDGGGRRKGRKAGKAISDRRTR